MAGRGDRIGFFKKAEMNLAAPSGKCLRSRGRNCLPGENRPAQSRANPAIAI